MKFINKTWARVLQLSPWQVALLVFLVSFVVRVAFLFVFRTYRDLGRYELERTAISLATTGVYGNPYAIPTGPTAHVSPGYTLILAGIFHVFGTGIFAEIVKQLVATLVTSVQNGLIPLAAWSLGLDRRAGLVAGMICALYPAKPLVQIDGDWETPYTALFLIVLCIITTGLWQEKSFSIKKAVQHGLLSGIALLFASVLLPVLVAFALAGAYFCRANLKRYVAMTACELAIVGLCLTPWMVRNYRALGKPIATRSNLGIELRVSNNDEASPDQRENYLRGVYARYHPLLNAEEAAKVRDMGEVIYNQRAQELTREWIQTHFRRYISLTLGRARAFWFYFDPTSPVKTIFLDITGLLGLLGALYVVWRKPVTGTPLVLVLLLYPAPNYLIHVGLRQRYPVDWMLTLLTMVVVFVATDWLSRTRMAKATTNTRRVTGAAETRR